MYRPCVSAMYEIAIAHLWPSKSPLLRVYPCGVIVYSFPLRKIVRFYRLDQYDSHVLTFV